MSEQIKIQMEIKDDDSDLGLTGITTLDANLSNGKKCPIMIHTSRTLFFTHLSEEFKKDTGLVADILYTPYTGDIILDEIAPIMIAFVNNSDIPKQTFLKTDIGYIMWCPFSLSFNITPTAPTEKEFIFVSIIKPEDDIYMDIECLDNKADVDFTFGFIEKRSNDLISNRMNTITSSQMADVLGFYGIDS